MPRDFLTASDFYKFYQCPHWPYFDRFATEDERALKREISELEKQRQENGLVHERDVVGRLFVGQRLAEAPLTLDPERDCEETLKLMRRGAPFIYQGTLTCGDWTGRPDILERHEGESDFGQWFYVPVDVKSTHEIEKYQKMQLVFYASLLEKLQGRFPAEPAILNSDGERLAFNASESIQDFQGTVAELSEIRAGVRPEPVLRKSCFDNGPWGKVCEKLAKMDNDVALLFNVDVRKLRALRQLGVRTVDDAAEMDPLALDGAAPGLRVHSLEVAKLQAQSLKNKRVIVRKPVLLEDRGLEIFFDIESDLPNDVDYLYGFLLRESSGDRYLPFVAESLEGEEKMWSEFLKWLETLPDEFTVYHFAVYEKTRLSVLEKRYGGGAQLERFRERMFDLKKITTSSVVFPLYFYGLKYISPFLGFEWKGSVKGGGQSIEVFEKYLETKDKSLLDAIVKYNEEDVRATARLKDWLVKYAKEVTAYDVPYPWQSDQKSSR